MARATWAWRRWIVAGREEEWIARLQSAGCETWSFTARPGRARVLLAVHDAKRDAVIPLREKFGGRVESVQASEWVPAKSAPPLRIGRSLTIYAEKPRKITGEPMLVIPHGLAFGSGEHATTGMLLRALTRRKTWGRVLDLGTGSGVLALAARFLGASSITATDFDADAVRTGRENEALNFSTLQIRWRRADVKNLRATAKYDLVLANLFSGILIEASAKIAGSVAPSGEVWLSGILREQEAGVVRAYRAQKLRLIEAARHGKWVMLRFAGSPE